MTDEMMNLRAVLEKSPDANPLRRMIGCSGRRRLAWEVGAPTGAA